MARYSFNGTVWNKVRERYSFDGTVWNKIRERYSFNGTVFGLTYRSTPLNYIVFENYKNNITYALTITNAYFSEFRASEFCYYGVPWTNGAVYQCATMLAVTPLDLTYYKKIKVTYIATAGYGDAPANNPRVTIYTVSNGATIPAPWLNTNVTAKVKYDTVHTTQVTKELDISGISGLQQIVVGNWSYNGTSEMRIYKIELTQ